MRIVKPSVTLRWVTPDVDREIEYAGRLAHKSEDKITEASAAPFIAKLLRLTHESVLEHGVASVHIVFDRGISHEMVRHRLVSCTQESTRFCTYGSDEGISVISPPDLRGRAADVWRDACIVAEQAYQECLRIGQPPEIARSVLPTCLKTEMVMTANFREWRHILRLRLSPKAHPQMREVAGMIRDILVTLSPACFGEFDA